jgi:hypothetical protein
MQVAITSPEGATPHLTYTEIPCTARSPPPAKEELPCPTEEEMPFSEDQAPSPKRRRLPTAAMVAFFIGLMLGCFLGFMGATHMGSDFKTVVPQVSASPPDAKPPAI